MAPEQLATLGPDVRRIDVREPDEFSGPLGHLPGAELVPLGTLEAVARSWSRETPLLLICRSGARSGRAAGYLAPRVSSGSTTSPAAWSRWRLAGLEVEG